MERSNRARRGLGIAGVAIAVVLVAQPVVGAGLVLIAGPGIRVLPSPQQPGFQFGNSVSVSGDTMAVGGVYGPVAVFVRTATGWTQQARLSRGDYDGGAGFIAALAGDTLLVGAGGTPTPAGLAAGAGYVWTRTGSSWTLQATLTASDGAAFDRLGEAAAISGDTVLLGARLDDTAGDRAGAAYVFQRSGSTWTEQAQLIPSDARPLGYFGEAVAIDGDTAIVAGTGLGAAYVFGRTGSTWTQQARLIGDDVGLNDYYGSAVAVHGDRALVAARFATVNGAELAGAVYVFQRTGSTWSQVAKLTASDPDSYEYLGWSVALRGDIALVGAPRRADTGTALAFHLVLGSWRPITLSALDGEAEDWFGVSVALDGTTAVAGAHFDSTPAGDYAGSAYVFRGAQVHAG